MGSVLVDLSISLDGFIAGPNDGLSNPLGAGGEALFAWMGAGPERNRVDKWLCPPDASMQVIEGWTTEIGAMVSGRRTFDIAGGWKDGHPIDVPNFVVTHDPPTSGEWSPRVEFVTEGVERAVELARGGGRRSQRLRRRGECRGAAVTGRAARRDQRQRRPRGARRRCATPRRCGTCRSGAGPGDRVDWCDPPALPGTPMTTSRPRAA